MVSEQIKKLSFSLRANKLVDIVKALKSNGVDLKDNPSGGWIIQSPVRSAKAILNRMFKTNYNGMNFGTTIYVDGTLEVVVWKEKRWVKDSKNKLVQADVWFFDYNRGDR